MCYVEKFRRKIRLIFVVRCFQVWRDVYLVIISCLFGVVFYLQTSVTFLAENMFQKRVMLYVALVAYGVVPSMHWVYLNGGFGAEIVHVSGIKC